MAQAVTYLLEKKVSRIILARPAVEAGEKLGFLPGDIAEKVNPYLRPLYDALYDMMDTEKATRLIERGTIEVAPIAFMRGRTLNDAFVILDEAQNTTSEQMKMFLTRLGFGSKAVVTGDITQIDLPTGRMSGSGRGAEGRRRRRGDRVRLLRRARRRPPQAGAADRQGVRRIHEEWLSEAAGRPTVARAPAACRSAFDGRCRETPVACARRARVLARVDRSGACARRHDRRDRPRCARARAQPPIPKERQGHDVLSFPARRAPGYLGDVVIAAGVAARQAREAGHSLATELRVLALHGLLHLLGYDHERDDGRMARLERRLRRRGGLVEGLIERA